MHLLDGEWWVQSDIGRMWGGLPSAECAEELAQRFTDVEVMLSDLKERSHAAHTS